ncbi:hypothetical protein EMIT0196MI5_190024 [Pseudomonas sp. IT-196MI5]
MIDESNHSGHNAANLNENYMYLRFFLRYFLIWISTFPAIQIMQMIRIDLQAFQCV